MGWLRGEQLSFQRPSPPRWCLFKNFKGADRMAEKIDQQTNMKTVIQSVLVRSVKSQHLPSCQLHSLTVSLGVMLQHSGAYRLANSR